MADLLGQFKPVGEKKWVKYSPKQKLGSGQFSKVYKGIYNNNKHFVAVKLIEHSERESNEAAIHQDQQLHHKNIVKFIFDDVHIADDVEKYVIVMELCDYTFDIFSRPAECAAINPLDAILGAANGLHYLHTKNILHCDVKPSNILLKKERDHWVAKLSDFGISRKQPKLNQQYGSITGPKGTSFYTPHEGKELPKAKVDKSWDVYAFGLVIFFVITNGKHPFGDEQFSIMSSVYDRKKPNFSLLENEAEPWKNINEKFMDLLSSMLSHDKNERPTMTEVLGYHLFWDPKKCIDFVQNVSDCLEGIRGKKSSSTDAEKKFTGSIQKLSKNICNNDWATSLKDAISKTREPNHRNYKAKNDVYQLLRIIRNWNHHYGDNTTEEFRKELGELPNGFWEYFSSRFPTLIPHVYRAIKTFYEESKKSGMQSWTRFRDFFEYSEVHEFGQHHSSSEQPLQESAVMQEAPTSSKKLTLLDVKVPDAGLQPSPTLSDTNSKPTLELRPYQNELIELAIKGENCMIVAPTGSGKTPVAWKIIDNHIKKEGSKRILFIVPKVELAIQQYEFFVRNLEGIKIQCVTSRTTGEAAAGLIMKQNRLTVLTPQFLVDVLKRTKSFVKLEDFSLMIFDECHHTSKEHPYQKIMSAIIKKEHTQPGGSKIQIVGLTASPGIGKGKTREKVLDNLIELLSRLNVDNYPACVIKEVESLDKHMTKNKELYRRIRPSGDEFYSKIQKAMEIIESDLKSCHVIGTVSGSQFKLPPEKEIQAYENWCVDLKKHLQLQRNAAVDTATMIQCAEHLQIYHKLLDLRNHIPTAWEIVADELTTCNMVNPIIEKLKLIKEELNAYYRENRMNVPLVGELVKILVKHFRNPDEDSRCIVFVRRKDVVETLVKYLNKMPETTDLKTTKLTTAHQQNAQGGMTSAEQKQTMKAFKSGESKLLVATSVAEEGLDIPACNLVIAYNYVTNEIGRVQRKGRGRAEHTRVILLALENSDHIAREEKNKLSSIATEYALEDIKEIPLPDLRQQIKELQFAARKKRERKEKEDKSSKSPMRQWKLHCGKCQALLAPADHLRHIDNKHKVLHDDDEYKHTTITRPNHHELDMFDGVTNVGSVLCAECKESLGCLMKFEGRRYKSLKCKKILFDHPGGRKLVKQWKKAPFAVEKGIEYDIQSDVEVEYDFESCASGSVVENSIGIVDLKYEEFEDYQIIDSIASVNDNE